jgi:AAHS family benzoate transporter-like MFS transporter
MSEDSSFSPPAAGQRQASVISTSRPVMALSAVALVFEGYDLYAYGAALPVLLRRADWALSPALAGAIGSAAVVGMLLGALTAGIVGDLVGRRPLYVASVVGYSLGSALCAVAPTPSFLLAARVVLGVGCGGLIPIAVAYVAEYSSARHRTVTTTMAGVAIGAGGGIGALIAIWVLPAGGYQALFWIGALPLLILVPLAWFWLPESVDWLLARGKDTRAVELIDRYRLPIELTHSSSPSPEAGPAGTGRTSVAVLFSPRYCRATVFFAIAAAMGLLLVFGSQTWLPALLVKSGYGMSSALTLTACLYAGMFVGSLLGVGLARHIGIKAVVMAGFVIASIALFALAARPPILVAYVSVVLLGAGASGTMNLLQTYVAIYYPARVRGSALGVALAFGRVGAFAGPIIVGVVLAAHVGVGWNFVVFAVAGVVGLVALTFVAD